MEGFRRCVFAIRALVIKIINNGCSISSEVMAVNMMFLCLNTFITIAGGGR